MRGPGRDPSQDVLRCGTAERVCFQVGCAAESGRERESRRAVKRLNLRKINHLQGYSPGMSNSRQPRVKAKGKGPPAPVLYMPSKKTKARSGWRSSKARDGLNGPECQPQSSAVM